MDCKVIENFFKERTRMCGAINGCGSCPLSQYNNGRGFDCDTFTLMCLTKAVEIVQKWSDEHPLKTF